MKCPACKQELPESERIVIIDNIIYHDGWYQRVSPQTATIMRLLGELWPDLVHWERILMALYPNSDDEPITVSQVVVNQRVVLARKHIRSLKLRIENIRNEGYRLAYPQQGGHHA